MCLLTETQEKGEVHIAITNTCLRAGAPTFLRDTGKIPYTGKQIINKSKWKSKPNILYIASYT